MLVRQLHRSVPTRLHSVRSAPSQATIRMLHVSSGAQSVDQSHHAVKQDSSRSSSSNSSSSSTEGTSKQVCNFTLHVPRFQADSAIQKKKMSAKERDEMMMQRMKERMGQEGDEGGL